MADELYSDLEKCIFRYFDGAKWTMGDPIEIHEKMALALGGEVGAVYGRCWATVRRVNEETGLPVLDDQGAVIEDVDTAVAYTARAQFREAVRFAFKMASWNPDAAEAKDVGASATDCKRAWDAYCDYLAIKKKAGESRPT